MKYVNKIIGGRGYEFHSVQLMRVLSRVERWGQSFENCSRLLFHGLICLWLRNSGCALKQPLYDGNFHLMKLHKRSQSFLSFARDAQYAVLSAILVKHMMSAKDGTFSLFTFASWKLVHTCVILYLSKAFLCVVCGQGRKKLCAGGNHSGRERDDCYGRSFTQECT